MKRNKTIIILKLFFAIAIIALTWACSDEYNKSTSVIKSDTVSFGTSSLEYWGNLTQSRSSSTMRTEAQLIETINGDEIYMYLIEENCPSFVIPVEANTTSRATTPLTSDDELDLGVFAYISPRGEGEESAEYIPEAASQFMINNKLDVSDNYSYTPIKYWPGDEYWLKFFGYRPYQANIKGDEGTFSIDATTNVPIISYTVPSDITLQNDLLSTATDMIKGDYGQTVQLTLNHVLSAVRVKVGSMNEGKIDYIRFNGINSSGTHSCGSMEWNVDEENIKDFNQSLTDFNVAENAGKVAGGTFYLMPQTLPDDATIEISLTITSNSPGSQYYKENTYILERKLNEFIKTWEPNKQYTYVLTTPEEITVEVTDKVEGKVKKDLKIRNTGLSTAYIRANIVGYWVTPNDPSNPTDYYIVSQWKESDGEFDWGTTPPSVSETTHWRKGNDGYYYYMTPVKRGEYVPVPLFNTYTLTASAPVIDAELELIIAAQAVSPADLSVVWPSDITDIINNSNN